MRLTGLRPVVCHCRTPPDSSSQKEKIMFRHSLIAMLAILSLGVVAPAIAQTALPPDITVAADGSGDFKSVQAAVQSIPRDNRERKIILVKEGVYGERINIDAANITIRGQSRTGTRIESAQTP